MIQNFDDFSRTNRNSRISITLEAAEIICPICGNHYIGYKNVLTGEMVFPCNCLAESTLIMGGRAMRYESSVTLKLGRNGI